MFDMQEKIERLNIYIEARKTKEERAKLKALYSKVEKKVKDIESKLPKRPDNMPALFDFYKWLRAKSSEKEFAMLLRHQKSSYKRMINNETIEWYKAREKVVKMVAKVKGF